MIWRKLDEEIAGAVGISIEIGVFRLLIVELEKLFELAVKL